MEQGLLITFEGLDGCGKSTQIERLSHWLNKQGIASRTFREPGGTRLSEAIRELLLDGRDPMNPVTELFLFSAARSQLVSEKVLPALERGEVVLLDRFYDSTTAYQGYGREVLDPEQIERLNRIASHGRQPDITFYLRLSPEQARRRRGSVRPDRIEKSGEAFYERVGEGFDDLAAGKERFITVDASRSISEMEREIREIVRRRIG